MTTKLEGFEPTVLGQTFGELREQQHLVHGDGASAGLTPSLRSMDSGPSPLIGGGTRALGAAPGPSHMPSPVSEMRAMGTVGWDEQGQQWLQRAPPVRQEQELWQGGTFNSHPTLEDRTSSHQMPRLRPFATDPEQTTLQKHEREFARKPPLAPPKRQAQTKQEQELEEREQHHVSLPIPSPREDVDVILAACRELAGLKNFVASCAKLRAAVRGKAISDPGAKELMVELSKTIIKSVSSFAGCRSEGKSG